MAETYYQWKRRIEKDSEAREAWEFLGFLISIFGVPMTLAFIEWSLDQIEFFEVLCENYTDEQLEAILLLGELLGG